MKNKIFLIEKKRNVKIPPKWTKEEDECLMLFVKRYNKKIEWKAIAKFIKNKNAQECKKRFESIYLEYKKGRWTKEEDDILLNLIKTYGHCWARISKIMRNRSGKQIKNRYDENLSPGIKKDKFSIAEDETIIKLYDTFNNNWSKYLNYLPTRSVKVIKRRYLRLKYLQEKKRVKSKVPLLMKSLKNGK